MDSINWHMEGADGFPIECFKVRSSQALLHRHDCLELNYIESGSGYYVIENKTFPIRPGDLFIINNEERHMAVHEEPISMWVIVFRPSWVWDGTESDEFLKPFFRRKTFFSNRIPGNGEETAEIARGIRRIVNEYESRKEGYRLIIRASLLTILALLNRHYETENALLKETEAFNESYGRIREVVWYIENHYGEHISLGELGRTAGMNETYLSTCFSKVMNTTIVKYIESVRLHHACMLLRTTEMPVTEVALACGYNNLSYFNRSFRQKIKTTPREYRKSGSDTALPRR